MNRNLRGRWARDAIGKARPLAGPVGQTVSELGFCNACGFHVCACAQKPRATRYLESDQHRAARERHAAEQAARCMYCERSPCTCGACKPRGPL